MKRGLVPRRRMTMLVVAFLLSASILGVLFYRKYEQGAIPVAEKAPEQYSAPIVTLLFADPGGDGLMRELREIDRCDTLPTCLENVIQELVNGPLAELDPTLPPSFSVRGIHVVQDIAFIDLGLGSLDDVPTGSSAEMTTIYSIVNTIVLNYPQIKKVKFLMEGEQMSTLKGHLDLREPIVSDFSLEKKK